MPGLVLDEIHEDKVIDAMPENGSLLKTKDNLDLSKPPDGMCRQNWFMLALLWLESLELRAPVAGLSIASTTSASLQDSSISRIGVYRFPTCRTLFFGSGADSIRSIEVVRDQIGNSQKGYNLQADSIVSDQMPIDKVDQNNSFHRLEDSYE